MEFTDYKCAGIFDHLMLYVNIHLVAKMQNKHGTLEVH